MESALESLRVQEQRASAAEAAEAAAKERAAEAEAAEAKAKAEADEAVSAAQQQLASAVETTSAAQAEVASLKQKVGELHTSQTALETEKKQAGGARAHPVSPHPISLALLPSHPYPTLPHLIPHRIPLPIPHPIPPARCRLHARHPTLSLSSKRAETSRQRERGWRPSWASRARQQLRRAPL